MTKFLRALLVSVLVMSLEVTVAYAQSDTGTFPSKTLENLACRVGSFALFDQQIGSQFRPDGDEFTDTLISNIQCVGSKQGGNIHQTCTVENLQDKGWNFGSQSVNLSKGYDCNIPAQLCDQNMPATVKATSYNLSVQVDDTSGVATAIMKCNWQDQTDFTLAKTADKAFVTEVGNEITFTIALANNGTTPITGISVNDPLVANQLSRTGDTNANDQLDLGETWVYTGTYTVTSTDIDTNLAVTNTVHVDSNEVAQKSASVTVPVAGYSIVKTATDLGGKLAKDDLINYQIHVANTATLPLTGIVVTDTRIALTGPTGDNGNGILDQGETWTYSGTYKVRQPDLNNATLDNSATVDSNELASKTAKFCIDTQSGVGAGC